MLTIEILNDRTGTDASANYRYRVLVNGTEIDRGTVKGHDRSQHWTVLVRKLVAERTQRAQREFAAERAKEPPK